MRIGEGFDRACQAAVEHLETIADAVEFSKDNTEVRRGIHFCRRCVLSMCVWRLPLWPAAVARVLSCVCVCACPAFLSADGSVLP